MKKQLWMVAAATLISAPTWAQNEVVEVQKEVTTEVRELTQEMRGLDQEIRTAVNQSIAREVRADLREVYGNRNDFDFDFSWDDDDDDEYRKRRRFRTEDSWNLEIGLNNFLTGVVSFVDESEPHNLDTWESHYIAITRNYSTKLAGPLYMEYGASVSWYNFTFANPRTRIEDDPDMLTLGLDTDASIVPIRAKLRTPYVNVHFVPVLDLSKGTLDRSYQGKGFRIGVGGYAGYRIGGKAKYVWEVDGDRRKAAPKGSYFMENFRYGVRGQVGFRGVDLFLNYDLNEVFTAGNGPQLNAFSFGIII